MVDPKQEAYEVGCVALTMRKIYPNSRLWRMRARQALKRLEELHGSADEILRIMQADEPVES